MSKSEHQRIADLQSRIMPNGKLSEGDVDWLLSLAQRPGTEQQMATRMQWVALTLASGGRDAIPASRRNAVFDFATQAVRLTGQNPGHDSSIGQDCLILINLGDKRAIPYLTPLLSSGNDAVNACARNAIHKISKPS